MSNNRDIEPAVALVFIYRVLKEHMVGVLKESKPDLETVKDPKEERRPESCLVLEKEPARKAFDSESNEDIERLDPFVDIALQCLYLKYDQILINSLRCFLLLLKFPLPALRTNMPKFLDRLFIFLADYTAFTTAGHAAEYAQNSLEVSQLVFKAFTQIIKDAPNFLLTAKRLQLLLTYAETDVFDSQKQAVAFPLIKAIIIRKLQDPKVTEIIQYLSETAITSEISYVREQCRQVILNTKF
ncbi:unnamed protein product [Gongylonema pulchrum]|uniref:HEAT repeat-containing protein 1 n=1 Tax=Gongylonema pulchrum TaxID=637853 RepID=A0A183E6R6_9BILA|nr:unnamed protein product [Gongylonema pulchrum]